MGLGRGSRRLPLAYYELLLARAHTTESREFLGRALEKKPESTA